MPGPPPVTFLIGRRSRDGCRILFLAPTPPPFPGPWELLAVTQARDPR